MSKRRKNQKTCDPALCDHCMYIGEGDFICDLRIGPGLLDIVIEGWQPTEDFLRCRRRTPDGH